MKIGIEAERANNPVKTGVEHYAKQLILHLAEIDRENEYVLYLRTKPEDWFLRLPKNFRVKVMPFPIFWTQLRVSWEMLRFPVDVLLVPASALPLIHPKKSVVTIHDIAWRLYPETFTGWMRNFLEWSTRFAISQASGIIAVSEATKKDLVRHYGADKKKITVVHHGYEEEIPNSKFQISNEATSRQSGIAQLPEKFVLFLSTLQPRKNLPGLIEAFVQLKRERPELPHKLVVAGRRGWMYEASIDAIQKYPADIVYLDHVSDEDRLLIMSRADALALPSFYEGFGMQILESFAASVPVVTSNVSSMPEVAGDAAVYFDPHNISDIKNALASVISDKGLADRLRERGKERLKQFSWERCARQTLEVLKR